MSSQPKGHDPTVHGNHWVMILISVVPRQVCVQVRSHRLTAHHLPCQQDVAQGVRVAQSDPWLDSQ